MRLAAAVVSIVALVLALPLLAQPAQTAADSASIEAAPEPSGDLAGDPLVALEIDPFAGALPAATCPSGEYFELFFMPKNPFDPMCNQLCHQGCQEEGGTLIVSFFDRIYCNCFCCAD